MSDLKKELVPTPPEPKVVEEAGTQALSDALASSFKDPSEDEARVAAVREAWKPIEPLTRGFYVNAMSEDMYAKVDANYGPNYLRLSQLKRKYDPGNQFRLNANVLPAA